MQTREGEFVRYRIHDVHGQAIAYDRIFRSTRLDR